VVELLYKEKETEKMQRDVIFSEQDGRLTAVIMADLDHHSAKPIREKIDERLRTGVVHTLVLDFSSVVFMDSSGMGLIMGRAECASSVGCRVVVVGLSPALMRLAGLCGLDRIKNLTVLGKERNYR
jgi:stage II sporulation protein AA (anti-sigma F factor antagonist)